MQRTRLLYLMIILMIIPGLPSVASTNHARVFFAPALSPSFAMPLPTSPLGAPLVPVPVSGVLHVLVIAAYFSDINYSVSIAQLKNEFFTGVNDYYHEISYGKVSVVGDVYGWYKLPYSQAHYGKDCLAIDDANCDGQDVSWEIAQDAAVEAQKDVNFANYNYFVFIHSGDGQESNGVKDEVWSVTYMGGISVETNTHVLTQFSIVSELQAEGAAPLGVWCHEFGHLLNLPDLFNTNTGKSILGPWSTMDEGTWNGNPPGSSPAHLISWGKVGLGFISGSMLGTAAPGVTSTYTIDPTEVVSSNVHAVVVPLDGTTNPSQYYMVEVRAKIGFDSALPAFGVLISLVNSNEPVGPIRIIDGHPAVQGLKDAVWNVGQTFTDTANGLSISVIGQLGNSYQVTVNRGGAPPPQPQPQNQTYISLAIASITAQPPVITLPNTTVTVTVNIENSGTETASNVPVEVDLDGQVYVNLQATIGAGTTAPSTFTWTSSLGTHTFKVVIDPDNTINNTNRANNSATFTLSVGPTLTINFPLNVSSTGNVWVIVNGVKYNITSAQFQMSVPNGTVTVEVQPSVNVSQGVRQSFADWSDGNTTNPRRIVVTSPTVLQVDYTTQYLLTLNSNGGTTTPSGWYSPNATVTVTAANPSNVTASTSRLLFTSWSGGVSSNSTTITIIMTKPMIIQANWITQYYLSVISQAGSPTGEGWYSAGTIVTVGVQSMVLYPNETRMVFNGWNSTRLGSQPTTEVTLNTPLHLRANWTTQYLITLNTPYGEPTGGGWYDAGANANVSIPVEIDYGNATRRVFNGWTGDYSDTANNLNFQVNGPKTLSAGWTTEYLVTFGVSGLPNATVVQLNLGNSTYPLSAGSIHQTWLESGATIDPAVNSTIPTGMIAYKFAGWRNATGLITQSPMQVRTPSTYVASYAPALSLPAIPGFPIEAIVSGLLLGLVIGVIKRKRPLKACSGPMAWELTD